MTSQTQSLKPQPPLDTFTALAQHFDKQHVLTPDSITKLHTAMLDFPIRKNESYALVMEVLKSYDAVNVIPDYVHSPPKFDPNWYPLNPETRTPVEPHPYDYTCNCDATAFLIEREHIIATKGQNAFEVQPYNVMLYGMEYANSQLAYGGDNMWHLVLAYMVTIKGKPYENKLMGMLKALYMPYLSKDVPFTHKRPPGNSSSKLKVQFFSDYKQPVSSLLPIFTHQWLTVAEACLAGEYGAADCDELFKQYLAWGKTSSFDAQLSSKDLFLMWIPHFVKAYKGGYYVGDFNQFMILNGFKEVKESDIAVDVVEDLDVIKDAEFITSFYKQQLLSGWKTIKGKKAMSRFYRRMLRASMDGLHIIGEKLFTAHKAVTARAHSSSPMLLPKRTVILDNETEVTLEYQDPDSQHTMWSLYKDKFAEGLERIRAIVESYDYGSNWVRWVTPRSGGVYEISDEIKSQLPEAIANNLNIRVVGEATSIAYRPGGITVTVTISKYGKKIVATQRFAAGRRLRDIQIADTDVMRNAYPQYVIEAHWADESGDAAYGKATGTLADMGPSLNMHAEGVIVDSQDASGFDASITLDQRNINQTEILRLMMTSGKITMPTGPDVLVQICDKITGAIQEVQVNSAVHGQLLNSALGIIQSASIRSSAITNGKGELLEVQTTGSTFGSGNTNTSTNHTDLNIAQDRIAVDITVQICKAVGWNVPPKCLRYHLNVLGDDTLRATCRVPPHISRLFYAVQKVVRWSFNIKTTGYRMTYYSDFLQQSLLFGMQLGKAARLTFHSAERAGTVRTRGQAASTIKDTLNEYHSRTESMDDLTQLAKTIIFLCHNVSVIALDKGDNPTSIVNKLKLFTKPLEFNDRKWLLFIVPVTWLYMKGGGEFPLPRTQTVDGREIGGWSTRARAGVFCERDIFHSAIKMSDYQESYREAMAAVNAGTELQSYPELFGPFETQDVMKHVRKIWTVHLRSGVVGMLNREYLVAMGYDFAKHIIENDPELIMNRRRETEVDTSPDILRYQMTAQNALNSLENEEVLSKSYDARKNLYERNLPVPGELAITEQPKKRIKDVLLARKLNSSEYSFDMRAFVASVTDYVPGRMWKPKSVHALYLYTFRLGNEIPILADTNTNDTWIRTITKIEALSTECALGSESDMIIRRLALLDKDPHAISSIRNVILDPRKLTNIASPILKFVENNTMAFLQNIDVYGDLFGMNAKNLQLLRRYAQLIVRANTSPLGFSAPNTPRRDFTYDTNAKLKLGAFFVEAADFEGRVSKVSVASSDSGELYTDYTEAICKDALFKLCNNMKNQEILVDIHPITRVMLSKIAERLR